MIILILIQGLGITVTILLHQTTCLLLCAGDKAGLTGERGSTLGNIRQQGYLAHSIYPSAGLLSADGRKTIVPAS